MYHKTTEELLKVLDARITEHRAEIAALDQVEINTKHKTLSNRAISGYGARLGDYVVSKALFVSYTIKYTDGHTKYESSTINAYTYEDENGNDLGSIGCLRISRLYTPVEMQEQVNKLIALRQVELKRLEEEANNAAKLVRQYNAIVDKVNAFEDGLTWATRSVLKVG